MINLDKEKYLGATADKTNDYYWTLRDKIVNKLDSFIEKSVVFGLNSFDIWDPLELKTYLCDSI